MLTQNGFESYGRVVEDSHAEAARQELFRTGGPGTRCLLDNPVAREIVGAVRSNLARAGRLPEKAVAIQAIAFDKTPRSNWKVTWHQDLMFPIHRAVQADGFTHSSRKDGVDYARPPTIVLEVLLAVRIHLDECDERNGPLRVSPGTHRQGVIRSADTTTVVAEHGEHACLAKSGEALLMKPLLLHASSPALAPAHRRVLHLVFHSGDPIEERWHRTV